MFPYLIVFSITTFFAYFSEREWNKNKKIYAYILGLTAVMLLSVFAGIRDYDVGTDNSFYILPSYNQAKHYMGDFSRYMKNDTYQLEPLYLVLSYIAAKIFRSPHFIMFVLSLLTNLFMYLGIVKLRRNFSISFAWLTYCLVYFNIGLNMMRQSVAIAIVFYVMSDVENKISWKKATIFFLFASLIHISGLIGFFFYIVYLLFTYRSRLSVLKFFVFIGLLSLPIIIPYLIQIMDNAGLLSGKYTVFVGNVGEMALGNIIFRVAGMFSFIVYCIINQKKRSMDYLIFVLYVGVINILLLFNNSLVFIRIGRYFEIFEVTQFTLGMRAYSTKNVQRYIISAMFLALMIFYWYYRFIVLGDGETYPYLIDPLWNKPV